jgi:ribosomal-protein-alanine N-acetyltransferase
LLTSSFPQYEQNNYGRWALHLKGTLEFMGWCGLKKLPEREYPDLGYRFMKKYWGKGYAYEAASKTIAFGFQVLQLPGIFAAAHVDNIASWKVLEKCGMRFTGFKTIDNTPTRTYEILNAHL